MSLSVVLDASALLAALQNEQGGDVVNELVLNPENKVVMSALNWSEVFDRLLRSGISEEIVAEMLDALELEIMDFNQEQARMAASCRMLAPALSLADRACLVLAKTRRIEAWTMDKVWQRLNIGVRVKVLR